MGLIDCLHREPIQHCPHADKTRNARKARYSERDNRVEAVAVPLLREEMSSVCCIVPKNQLIANENGEFRLEGETLKEYIEATNNGLPLAKNEKFGDQITPGSATAFLVGKRILLTAAHCVCKDDGTGELDPAKIKDQWMIFNFEVNEEGKTKTLYKEEEIYHIKNVIQHRFVENGNQSADWALIKLDKKVEGRTPLQLSKKKIDEGSQVTIVGHPSGLPKKAAKDGICKGVDENGRLQVAISAFHGNSGSPIFKGEKVRAILISGHEDYEIKDGHVVTHRVSSEEIKKRGYEKAQCINDDIIKNVKNANQKSKLKKLKSKLMKIKSAF